MNIVILGAGGDAVVSGLFDSQRLMEIVNGFQSRAGQKWPTIGCV